MRAYAWLGDARRPCLFTYKHSTCSHIQCAVIGFLCVRKCVMCLGYKGQKMSKTFPFPQRRKTNMQNNCFKACFLNGDNIAAKDAEFVFVFELWGGKKKTTFFMCKTQIDL